MDRKIRWWAPAFLAIALVACGRGPGGAGGGDRAAGGSGATGAADRSPAPAGAAAGPASGRLAAPDDVPVVLFLGNSLTAGLGLLPEQAFPSLIQAKMDSAGLRFRAVNAGVSGATSADGVRLVGSYLELPVAVVVLELGANDMLRGQDLDATRRNLQAIIDSVRSRRPAARIVIAGMRAPPNLGQDYTDRFRAVFPELGRRNHAALIPFLLADVAADTGLNQGDGMHPNAAGERIVAANVWRVLEGVLREIEASRSDG
jgi:acyl-CoA thioesterase-1